MSNSFATPWTAAQQAPLSMWFSRQEYWRGLSFPSPGDPPNPGIEPESPALACKFKEYLESIFCIMLVVEALSLQKAVEMLEGGWKEVRWIQWITQNFLAGEGIYDRVRDGKHHLAEPYLGRQTDSRGGNYSPVVISLNLELEIAW